MITALRTSPVRRLTTLAMVSGGLALGAGAATGVATAAGPRSTARRASVPPIHEPFGHQRCPANASSTLALEECAEDRVLSLDAKIDRLDTAITKSLPARGQTTFASAAREWLSYRNTVAKAAASADGDGSAAPLAQLGALASEDGAHISALTHEFASMTGQRP